MKVLLATAVLITLMLSRVEGQSSGLNGTWVNDLSDVLTRPGIPEDTKVGTVIGTLLHEVEGQRKPRYTTTSIYFSVDPDSGVVTLARALDYRNSPFSVDFYASIPTVDGYRSLRPVIVNVLPVNHAPAFDAPTYAATVSEAVAVGTTVFDRIYVTDRDTGPNGTVTINCLTSTSEGATACQSFSASIQRTTDEQYQVTVIVSKALDYNVKNSYTLQLQAADGGTPPLTDTATLAITIGNSRDTRPVILGIPIYIQVPEMAPNTTDLPSISARRVANSQDSVVIKIANDPLHYFYLEPTVQNGDIFSAKIRTTGTINRLDLPDLNNQYIFYVKAISVINGQESSVTSDATVTVQVIDINNNPPTFNPTSYTANVTEGMPFQATVPSLSLLATDLDQGDNAYFVLEAISSPLPADVFGVIPNSGSGSVAASLIVLRPDQLVYDDPTKRQHVVTVIARESRTAEKRSGTATVTINVLNPNNQPTPFAQNIYSISIDDNRQVDNLIQTVATSDTNNPIKYAITDGNSAQLFKINENTGDLTIARPLNATLYPQVILTASATNQYGLVAYATVNINIRDSRSQGPKFEQEPYDTIVDENDTLMVPTIRIWATPLKSDKVVRYSIVGGNEDNIFMLNTTGNPPVAYLVMRRGVDYNETPNRQGFYLLTVQAADDVVQPLTTNTTVSVRIRDKNNHAPTFWTNMTYYTSVTEITPPGTSILHVKAEDLDAGDNADVHYVMGFGSKDNFAIDYKSGVISVAPISDLSIEKYGDLYNITVYAMDKGSPQLTGTATIYVKVNSSIYQTPLFNAAEYVFTISDSIDIGANVGAVSAYSLDPGALLAYQLDLINATATDVNGQPVTYTNSTYNFREAFKIVPTSGVIQVAQKLNRQYAAIIQFFALASVTNPDRPTPPAQVSVTVRITTGGQGTQPIIYFYRPAMVNNVVNVSIIETPTAGGPITQFSAAYGIPTGVQTPVSDFSFGNINDPNGLLVINNQTGALTIAKPISYDSLPSKVLTYEIVARAASPSTLSATATIHVNIRSLSEGRPVWSQNSYNFSIKEDASLNALVGQVKATLKVSGRIQYRLTGFPNDFSINPDTGDITVMNPLDAETRPKYILTATTVDASGQGQLQSVSALVQINVLDVNERGPQFLGEPYAVDVYDTAPVTTSLIQVQAIDTDASQTPVRYEITGGNEKGLFVIDPITGIIKPTRSLQNASQPTPYILQVTAWDSGNPPLSTTTTVNILIRNQSAPEGPPIFVRPIDGDYLQVYENYYNENVTDLLGTPVYAYAVTGRPRYPNITYGFYDILSNEEANKKFTLDPISGRLTTSVALNRTERSSYELVLQALDGGSPALTSRITVNVTVYSDGPPTFTSCPGTFSYPEVDASVLEKKDPGEPVTTVKACMYDKVPRTIYYYITAGNSSYLNDPTKGPPFTIGKTTGKITTNERLSWYDSPVLYINVTASTNSFGPESALKIPGATVTVRIAVNGTDANGPTFEPQPGMKEFCRGIGKQYTTGILDITDYGVQIVQYYAGDCDSPENRNHTFSLESITFSPPNKPDVKQSTPQSFTIDPNSGWVLTGETSYRKYTDGIFKMTVRVTDKHNPPRGDISTLTVYIIRESQRLRYVFSKGPVQMEDAVPNFIGEMNTALDGVYTGQSADIAMISDILRVHVNNDAAPEFSRSDLCFHVREKDKVLNVDEVQTLYKQIPSNTSSDIYNRYSVDNSVKGQPVPCNVHVTTKRWSGKYFLWWLLIALALFIILIALILIICVCVYWPISRRNYFKSRPYVVLDEPPTGATSEFEWQHSIHRVD